MLIPIRIPRTTKPPIGTPIDWSNPLTQGLVGVWAFNEGGGGTAFDTAEKNSISLDPLVSFCPGGVQQSSDNSGSVFNSPIVSGTKFSFLTGISIRSTGKYHPIVMDNNGGGGFYVYNDQKLLFYNFGTNLFSTVALSVGKQYDLAFIGGGTQNSIFINGSINATVAATTLSKTMTRILDDMATGDHSDMQMSYLYYYSTAKSPDEIASLSANPWQIYEPEIQWVTVAQAAAFKAAWAMQSNQFLGGGFV